MKILMFLQEFYRFNAPILLNMSHVKRVVIGIIDNLEELDWDSEYKYQELEVLAIFVHQTNRICIK